MESLFTEGILDLVNSVKWLCQLQFFCNILHKAFNVISLCNNEGVEGSLCLQEAHVLMVLIFPFQSFAEYSRH